MELSLRHVIPDSDDFRYVSELYDLAFPKAEQERMENIIKVSENTQFGELSVVMDGDTRVGMLYLLFNKDLVYIYYLAIDPGMRGRGYGSAIISMVRDSYPDHRFALGCEAPDEKADNNVQRLDRMRFYERNGFRDTGRRTHWDGVTYAQLEIGRTGRFEVGKMFRLHSKYSKRYRYIFEFWVFACSEYPRCCFISSSQSIIMRKFLSAIVLVLVLIAAPLIISDGSDACTGFYVGSDVSETGGTLIGQTADSGAYSPAVYRIVESSSVPGRTLTGTNGFVYALPDTTYRYYTSDIYHSPGAPLGCGNGVTNEKGLAYSGSITAYTSTAALTADPLVTTGLGEELAGEIVGACCSSAKEAVQLIATIIDTYGSAERNIYIFADKTEAWYMESYSGHQYAAVKLPKDKVAFFGNEFGLVYLEDFGNDVLTSQNFKKLADDSGFAVYDAGKLNLMKTYQRPLQDYGHMRTWMGHQKLAPSQFSADYDLNTVYPLLFTPDDKVSVKQIADLLRNRFEGTQYCPDVTGKSVRVAGVENTSLAHILEIRSDLPDEMCTIKWNCIGPTVYGVFIPCSSGTLSLDDAFVAQTYKYSVNDDSAYGLMKLLNSMLTESGFLTDTSDVSKDILTDGVRKYWSDMEVYYSAVYDKVIEKAKEYYQTSPQDALNYLTTYTKGIQNDQMIEAHTIYEESQLALMMKTSTKGSRSAVSPFIDVEVLAKRFGWDCTITADRATFTHGSDVITIDAPALYSEDGTLKYGASVKTVKVHLADGRYRIQYSDALVFVQNGTPVVVDYGFVPSAEPVVKPSSVPSEPSVPVTPSPPVDQGTTDPPELSIPEGTDVLSGIVVTTDDLGVKNLVQVIEDQFGSEVVVSANISDEKVDLSVTADSQAPVISETMAGAILDSIKTGDSMDMRIDTNSPVLSIPSSLYNSSKIDDIRVGFESVGTSLILPNGALSGVEDQITLSFRMAVSDTGPLNQPDMGTITGFDLGISGANTTFQKKVSVSVPFSIPYTAKQIQAYCVDTEEYIDISYLNGIGTFEVDHFSRWAIVYSVLDDGPIPVIEEPKSDSGNDSIVYVMALSVVCVAIGCAFLLVKKH